MNINIDQSYQVTQVSCNGATLSIDGINQSGLNNVQLATYPLGPQRRIQKKMTRSAKVTLGAPVCE